MVGQTAEALIGKLNPLVRGWANYHRHVCAGKAFGVVDRIIQTQLLGWARRKHPNKSRGWLKRRYFSAAGKGVFSTRKKTGAGESCVLALYRTAKTIIQRHIKVRGEANPYDRRYTEYFEQRRCFAWRVLTPGGKIGQTIAAKV
jgi:RNA-directed DNA polymerase